MGGLVATFGSGQMGQLGHDDYRISKVPKFIKTVANNENPKKSTDNSQIVHIAAGPNCTILVSRNGIVYACGNNVNGMLGLGKDVKKVGIPTAVAMPPSTFIVSVECGKSHSLFLSSKGRILACGMSRYCAHRTVLFRRYGNEYTYEAKPIQSLAKGVFTSLAAGDSHSLCLSERKKVYSFGNGNYGALGHGNRRDHTSPKKIEYFSANNIEVGSVYANHRLSAAITVGNDELYLFGNSKYVGTMGLSQPNFEPKKLPLLNLKDSKIMSVSFGQRYIGIISESKEESKENEFLLKGGEEMTVQNNMNDVENTKVQDMYVQNSKLFGDDGWIQIESNAKYVFFPYFGNKFVENLVLNEEQTMIELIDYSEIDSIYHSDIMDAQFFFMYRWHKKENYKKYDSKTNIYDQSEEIYFFKY